MNWKAPLEATGRGLKSLARMVFREYPYRMFNLARSHIDWIGEVGDGTGSSTVTAPLFWVARTFPEAPPMLWQQLENGQETQVRAHKILQLLQRPNRSHTGPILWMATTIDWMVDGNAYWLKLRDGTGLPSELWWVPHWVITPKGSKDKLITHYEYTPGGEKIDIRPEDVVHFRFGLDSDSPALGRSPLKSVLREVFTDDEAADFTASLLRNMGVPGLMVSPAPGVKISEEQALATKASLLDKFTGDSRGEPIVMTGATNIEQFGFSPEQLLLRELRRIPEERVTAVMGVPAIVAGLGAGLDRSTFTNMAEAREAAYESGIIPMQRILAEEIRFQLLSEWIPEPALFQWRFGFDLTKVRVLQEDQTRLAERHIKLVNGGLEMVSEGRRAVGLDVDAERDNIFLRPGNFTQVDGTTSVMTPLSTTATNGNSNGAAALAAASA